MTDRVTTGWLTALEACSNATFACTNAMPASADCQTKALKKCASKLGSAEDIVQKAALKVATAKSCAQDLHLSDLLAPNGLGLLAIASSCLSDLGLDVCQTTGVRPLAQCLAEREAVTAQTLYGISRPRTGELLEPLLPVLPPVDGLPIFEGCAEQCPAIVPPERKAILQCAKVLTKSSKSLTAKLRRQLTTCSLAAFGCVQSTANAIDCTTDARSKCDKSARQAAAAVANFHADVAKGCGGGNIPFDTLMHGFTLNLSALSTLCPAPTSIRGVSDCIADLVACGVAHDVRSALPRVADLVQENRVGGLNDLLTRQCPIFESRRATQTVVTSGLAQRALVFGGISKILRGIRRGPLDGVRRIGKPPTTTPGGSPGIRLVSPPVRALFGSITKIPFVYNRRTVEPAMQRQLADSAPKLVVTREGVDDEYFEVDLSSTAVRDDLLLAYQDALPGCFTLAFAITDGEEVSEYTTLAQVGEPGTCGGP